jgi:hypothetical protein
MVAKNLDTFAMIAVIFFAIANFIASCKAIACINAECESQIIKIGWTTILTLSSCLIIAPLYYFLCTNAKGAKCYKEDGNLFAIDVYLMIVIFLNVCVMVLSSVMYNYYINHSSDTLCDDSSGSGKLCSLGSLGISILMILGSGIILGMLRNEKLVGNIISEV